MGMRVEGRKVEGMFFFLPMDLSSLGANDSAKAPVDRATRSRYGHGELEVNAYGDGQYMRPC